MSERKTYEVTAIPWEHGLELYIEDKGITQSLGMEDAEQMVRDYLYLAYDLPEDSYDVHITLGSPVVEDG